MEKIIAELAEMLASAERVQANAERRYLEAPGSFENGRNEYMCGYVDAMRHALQAVKEYHQQQYIIREARKSAGWRELYAIEHGTPSQAGNVITWTYGKEDDHQDANGAAYDISRRRWVK